MWMKKGGDRLKCVKVKKKKKALLRMVAFHL